jgi:hypothetical protein
MIDSRCFSPFSWVFGLRHFFFRNAFLPFNAEDMRGGASSRAACDRIVEASGLPKKALTLEGLLLGGRHLRITLRG